MDENDKNDAYEEEDWDEDEEDDDEEYEDEEYDDEEYDDEEDEQEDWDEDDEDAAHEGLTASAHDPWWWLPHAVLGLLLLVGLLGFFGFFNPWLGFLAATPAEHHEPIVSPQPASTKPVVKPNPALRPPNKGAATSEASAAAVQRFSAKEILIQFKGAALASAKVTRSRKQAVDLARTVLTKALKTMTSSKRQQDWEQLVKQYGDVAEPDPDRPGSRMPPPPVVKTIKGMKAGDIEGPIETKKGFYIVWRTR